MGQDSNIQNLQFAYTADVSQFDKASDKVEKQLIEQEKLLQKTEKSFLSLNKVLLAGGVGLSVLAVKKMPKFQASLVSAGKSGLGLAGSLEKIFVASQGVFGPFAKIATRLTAMTAGFEVASLGMSAMGVSTAGLLGQLGSLSTFISGGLLLAMAGLISTVQAVSDNIANSLIARLEDSIEVGARLEAQTFSLGLSLENYRNATGDASVTTEAMTDLLDDLGRTTGLTRGALKGGLTQMLNLSRATGLTADQIKVLIGRAADMSVALGTDFNEAVIAIDQSFKGYNQQLLNFGVNITESSLGATQFVQNQDRTVDALGESQLAMAKYEDILKQSASSVGALSKANLTISGSALNAELAVESFSNRLGEASQKIFGPAIVKLNNLRASMFDLAGQGGAAKLSASVTAVGAVIFKSIALVLKWGTAIVLVREGFKILKFVLGNTGKFVGLFNRLLRFLATITQTAAVGLDRLSKSTGKYAFAAKAASKATVGLNVAASGFNTAANASENLANKVGSRFGALGGISMVLWKVLKGLSKVLGGFLLQLGRWSLIAVVVGGSLIALVSIFKSLFKTILAFAGLNPGDVFDFVRQKVDGLSEALKNMALFLVSLPERISLSFEFITNTISLAILGSISAIGLLSSKAEQTLARLRQENEDLADILANLGNEQAPQEVKTEPREFKDSRALQRARKEAELERLDLFNSQEATAQRISFIQEKIRQTEEDTLAIVKPNLAIQKQIAKLEAERERLRQKSLSDAEVAQKGSDDEKGIRAENAALRARKESLQNQIKTNLEAKLLVEQQIFQAEAKKREGGARSRKESVDLEAVAVTLIQENIKLGKESGEITRKLAKSRQSQASALKKEAEISKKILTLQEKSKKVAVAGDREQEARNNLQIELIALKEEEFAQLRKQKALVSEVTKSQAFSSKVLSLQNEAVRLQNVNRFQSIAVEKELLELREKDVLESQTLAKIEAGGKLGDNEELQFKKALVDLGQEKLDLIAKEKALQRSLLDELGPLNKQFQDARRLELQQRLSELRDAGASIPEIARIHSEAERANQRDVLNETAAQSDDAVKILKAKMSLFFEDARTIAQKTADTMFQVFQVMDSALSDTLSNIATGVTGLKKGFKDFTQTILNSVVSTFVELGIQQAKTFLIQKSGMLQTITNLQTEGSQVAVLISQYAALGQAKAQASVSGSVSPGGQVAGTSGFFGATGLQQAPIDRTSAQGAAGPLLPGGGFTSSGSKFSSTAIGLGSVAGGIGANAIFGGPNASQFGAIGGGIGAGIGFAVGGPFGAAAGSVVGSLAGGALGNRRDKRKEKEQAIKDENLKKAQKFFNQVDRLLETGAANLDEALKRINEEIKVNEGEIKESLIEFGRDLAEQVESVVINFTKLREGLAFRLEVLGTDEKLRGTVEDLESLKNEMEAIRSEFEKLPSAAGNAGELINKLFNDSIAEMARGVGELIKEENKSFSEAARKDSGELISVAERALIDIKKLGEDRVKFVKDQDKQIKDIENEGVAQRQKTIKKSKEERITKAKEEKEKGLKALDDQISTIQIVSNEQTKAHNKLIKELKERLALIAAAKEEGADLTITTRDAFGNKRTGGANGISGINATPGTPGPTFLEEYPELFALLIDGSGAGLTLATLGLLGDGGLIRGDVGGFLDDTKEDVKDFFSSLGFAKGGPVQETGPALVHEGEFVVKKSVAQPLLPILEALNSNRVPAIRPLASTGSNQRSALPDMSVTINVGSIDSPDRVREIEQVITRLQRRQLNSVRQMVQV